MTSIPVLKELSPEEIVHLGRHVTRIHGLISTKILAEYLPDIDAATSAVILQRLIESQYIRKTEPGAYYEVWQKQAA